MSRSFDLLTDACAELAHTPRRMFGGHGFFAPNGGMFAAVISNDEVILKFADETARAELVALGGHAWVYTDADRAVTMAQWIVVPESFYDDAETFSAWAKRAHTLVPAKVAKARGKKPPAPEPKPRRLSSHAAGEGPTTPKRTATKKPPPKQRASRTPRAKTQRR